MTKEQFKDFEETHIDAGFEQHFIDLAHKHPDWDEDRLADEALKMAEADFEPIKRTMGFVDDDDSEDIFPYLPDGVKIYN